MNKKPTLCRGRLAALLFSTFGLMTSVSAGLITSPYLEQFDDAVTDLTTFLSPSGGTATIDITDGRAVFFLDGDGSGNPRSALSGTLSGGIANDFSISAQTLSFDTGTLDIDFSNSAWGLFAGATNAETNGLSLRINIGFASSGHTLELLNGSTVLDSTSMGNLSGSFDIHDGILQLVGSFGMDGSLALTGTFTDNIPGGNGGDNSRTVTATLDAGSVPTGELFGLRTTNLGGSNELRVEFDDLDIEIVIPEPATVAFLSTIGLSFVLIRRRQLKSTKQ